MEKLLKYIPLEDKQEFFFSLQSMGQLLWDCVCSMQIQAEKSPLATDKLRDSKFASVLRQYMNNHSDSNDEFTYPWEWFTLSIMLISPCYGECKEHKDQKNCTSYAYSKTACSNFIIIDNESHIYLLQILTNFRDSIENNTFPYHRHCNAIVNNSKLYLSRLKEKYQELFAGKFVVYLFNC